jgi:hypothetical protein
MFSVLKVLDGALDVLGSTQDLPLDFLGILDLLRIDL